jgi:small multidrug resistance pump
MKNWLFLIAAILMEIVATSALKASDQFSKVLPTTIMAVGYIGFFWFLYMALRSIPLGIAYAVWSGVGILAMAVIAVVIFGQTIDRAAVIGVSLIIAGVLVITLFSKGRGRAFLTDSNTCHGS